jgi:hypothetical protein
VTSNIIEAWVSIKRTPISYPWQYLLDKVLTFILRHSGISDFLNAEETQPDARVVDYNAVLKPGDEVRYF